MLARTDQVWLSDNTDALDRLSIQYGYSQIYPAQTMAAWITDCPNPVTGRSVPLRFSSHVAMAGVMALGGNLREWTDEELREAAEHVATYKRIRHVVQQGRMFRLRGPQAVQYVSEDGAEVVVFRYVPVRSYGHEDTPLRLVGLDANASYRDEATGAVYPGALLLTHGLQTALPTGDYASAVVSLSIVR
jgi:alpha-galactosidase